MPKFANAFSPVALLPTPEIRSSNPDIGTILELLFKVERTKIRGKEDVNSPYLKIVLKSPPKTLQKLIKNFNFVPQASRSKVKGPKSRRFFLPKPVTGFA